MPLGVAAWLEIGAGRVVSGLLLRCFRASGLGLARR